jgi:hypothetical protein
MSRRHAERPGEYPRLACAARRRLLASPFASQFQAASAAGNVHLWLISMVGGTVVGVTGRRWICAQSVDICVEAQEVAADQAPRPHRQSADNCSFMLRASGSSADAQTAAECE